MIVFLGEKQHFSCFIFFLDSTELSTQSLLRHTDADQCPVGPQQANLFAC